MGGYGATRWGDSATRATTGGSFALSTAALAPYMDDGSRAVDWTWSRGGKPVGSVRGVASRDEVLLWYTLTRAGGGAEDVQYDYPACRAALAERGIADRIARRGVEDKRRLGRHRWVVERSFGWLARERRLAIRYERHETLHQAFLDLACALLCLNALTRL